MNHQEKAETGKLPEGGYYLVVWKLPIFLQLLALDDTCYFIFGREKMPKLVVVVNFCWCNSFWIHFRRKKIVLFFSYLSNMLDTVTWCFLNPILLSNSSVVVCISKLGRSGLFLYVLLKLVFSDISYFIVLSKSPLDYV